MNSTLNRRKYLQHYLHPSEQPFAACYREAELGEDLDSPQQYGIWEVAGLGLAIAFRGTASPEDVFIDVNIRPVPLTSEQGDSGEHHLAYPWQVDINAQSTQVPNICLT